MKKLALLTIAMAFVFGANAQSISGSVKAPNMRIAPKERGIEIMPAMKPVKKTYEPFAWVSSTSYLGHLLPNSYTPNYTTFTIFPDSCMNNFEEQAGDVERYCTWMNAIGNSFDPYSESFDRMFADAILPPPICHTDEYDGTYGYKIDTVLFTGLYYWGERDGYNSSSPDTLRVYLSYHHVYQWADRTEWVALHYVTDTHGDTALFSPLVKVDTNMVKQPKGTAITPIASSCVTLDYILTDKDSTYYFDSIDVNTGDTTRYFQYTNFVIPTTLNGATENGFEVPAGAVVSCIAKYIPGYDYQLGDTLTYAKIDANNYYEKGYPKYIHNILRLRGMYEDKVNRPFPDPWGYNANFFEHYQYGRYQMGNSALYKSMYYPVDNYLPLIYYFISSDDELVKVVDSNACRGIGEAKEMIESIYPNPANDMVTVSLKNEEPSTITIYNVMGQAVKTIYATEAKTTVNIRDLSAGMYIISIEQNGLRFNSKLSKK